MLQTTNRDILKHVALSDFSRPNLAHQSGGGVGTKIQDVMMTKILSGYFWIPPPTIKKKAF